MKRNIFSVCILSVLGLMACNSADSAVEQQAAAGEATGISMPEIDHWLVVSDSIGVELGDSNMVFGQIIKAEFMPNGNIITADLLKSKISIFSPDGEYLTSIGRKGSGPGEFQILASFAVTDSGCVIVPDAMGGKLNFYDAEYNFTDEISGFYPAPPIVISPVRDGFVGLKPEFIMEDDNMQTGIGIYLWTDTAACEIEYIKNMLPFDSNDMGATVKTMVFFATDHNDNVILAPYSTEDYVITALSPDGEQIWQIIEEFDRVKKSDAEIEEELEMIRSQLVANGAPASMAEHFMPEDYKIFIEDLAVDNKNRVWVQSGRYNSVVYRVYDCTTGDFLFTAALRTDDVHEKIIPAINGYGITGLIKDSDTWSRLYLIQPEDPNLFN